MSQRDDEARLRDMLDAARKAVRATSRRTREELDRDEVFAAALERFVEIIGEAASCIAERRRHAMKDIPWTQIIGMRNRLIHGYMTINPDILWKAVCQDLPELISELERELSE